jgi:hypothetical protein
MATPAFATISTLKMIGLREHDETVLYIIKFIIRFALTTHLTLKLWFDRRSVSRRTGVMSYESGCGFGV